MIENSEIREMCTKIYDLYKNNPTELDIYLKSLSDNKLLIIMDKLFCFGIPEEHVVLFNIIYPELQDRNIDYIKNISGNEENSLYKELNQIPVTAKLFLELDNPDKLNELISAFSKEELSLIEFDLAECNLFISTKEDEKKSRSIFRLISKEHVKRNEDDSFVREKKYNC